jgi:hypothetical protein
MSDETNQQPSAEPVPTTKAMAASLWDKMSTGEKPAEKPAEQKQVEKPAEKPAVETPVLPTIIKKRGEEKPAEQGEQKAESPDFDKLIGPDEKSKHRPDWDKMKAAAAEQYKARSAAEARLKELEAKLAQAPAPEADAATKARLQQLEAQVKDYDEKLKVFDVQLHPDFQKQYIEPQKEAVTEIQRLFQIEGVEDVDVQALLALDGKKFAQKVSEALDELTPFSKTAATELFRKAKMLQSQQKDALGKVDELRTQYTQAQQARARAAFDAVGKNYSEMLPEIAVPDSASDEEKQAIAEYNASLKSVNFTAEKLAFGKVDDRAASEMAHKAARFDFLVERAMPRFEKMVTQELAKYMTRAKELEKQVADMTAARPNYSPSGDGSAGSDDAQRPGESTFTYAKRMAAKAGFR